MSKKKETIFKEKIQKDLNFLNPIYHEKIQQVAISGTPDMFICICGLFIAFELKKDKISKISEIQLYKLKKIYHAGGIALIVYPEIWSFIYEKLRSIANDNDPRKTESYNYLRKITRDQFYSKLEQTDELPF